MDECAFQPFGGGRETLLEETFSSPSARKRTITGAATTRAISQIMLSPQEQPSGHQRYLQIHHIGQCRAGKEKIMGGLEQMIGIVLIEECSRIQALSDGTFDSFTIDNGTRCIGRSVCTIRAGTQYDNLINAAELDRRG